MRIVSILLCIALTGCAAEAVAPSSKLLHFDSPNRVPEQYVVAFKEHVELLRDVPPSVARKLKVSPNTIPNDPKSIEKLAEDLAAAYHGHLGVWVRGFAGFEIKDISEPSIKRMAIDPRIQFIQPEVYAHTDASPHVAPRIRPERAGRSL